MHFPIITPDSHEQSVSRKDFVKFWSHVYGYPDEEYHAIFSKELTKDEVRKRDLTEDNVKDLFIWKNGGLNLSKNKKIAVNNFLTNGPTVPDSPSSEDQLKDYFKKCGSLIWSIFWLHCNHPFDFPIFDQHVYRAMCFLKFNETYEVPSYAAYRDVYIKLYIPFFQDFQNCANNFKTIEDIREIDRALVTFGDWIKK